jgi:hypothetical protein
MAFMTFNKDKAVKAEAEQKAMFGLIDPGTYEVFVEKAEYRDKKGMTPNINVSLIIRSDVEQGFKGRKFFHTFWISQKKETSLEFCMNILMSFMNKIGLPDGTVFGTPQEVAAYMKGHPVTAVLKIEKDQKDKDRNEVDEWLVSDFQGQKVEIKEDETKGDALKKIKDATTKTATKAATKTAVEDDPFDNDGGPIDISDDDLPF